MKTITTALLFGLLLFVAVLFPFASSFGQGSDFIFKRINADMGLSNDLVRCIIQDYQGFMWFGTANGLNKYDGYDITIYQNNEKDSSSLKFNDVFSLFEDSQQNLWVGTHKGLDMYDRKNDVFIYHSEVAPFRIRNIMEDKEQTLWVSSGTEFYYKKKNARSFVRATSQVVHNEITALCEDSDGIFWVGTSKNLYTYNRKTRDLTIHDEYKIHSVQNLLEDSEKNLWLGSYSSGLHLIDKKNKKIVRYLNEPKLDAYNTLSIYDMKDGKIWVGAENRGLLIYDYKNNNYQQFRNIEGDDHSLSFNSVNAIYKDHSGNTWLGTYMGGVNFLEERKFKTFSTIGPPHQKLSSNYVMSFCEDENHNIWVATDGGGLNFYNRKDESITWFQHNDEVAGSIPNDYVTSVVEDKDGVIWVGMWAGGIARFDKEKKKFINYKNNPDDPKNSLVYDGVVYLYADKDSDLWVCTVYGMDRFDKKTEKFVHYDLGDNFKNHVRSIFEDDGGNLWLCTVGGLLVLNKESGSLKVYTHDDANPRSLSNDLVMNVFVDSKDRIWVSTGGGLNLFDRNTETFTVYNQNNYLPNETIYGVLEDSKGNLWLSTANGICRFNPESKKVRNFTVSDGLQGNQFREHTMLKLSTGEMIFGGTNGFNILVPEKIEENLYIPQVIITGFKIFNKPVPIDPENGILNKSITLTDRIELSYRESVFSFDFAALNYSMPEKNQYAYMLQGFENDWNYVGNKRSATYTNLDPGEYIFRVKASNNDGLWNEEGTSIKVIITPPYWQTWWFRLLLSMAIVIVGFTAYNMRLKSIKKQNEQLERQVEERTHDLNLINEELRAHKQKLEKQAYDLSHRAEELKTANEKIASDSRRIEMLYREVTDSIRAAEVVQKSVLPTASIQKHFPESFILHKPKDVVSGDFFWFNEHQGDIVVAVADCTGHGVSGALMSINGHHLLNRVVSAQSRLRASDILNKLNKEFISEIHQDSKETMATEGMEISLCTIDKARRKLQFAGSGNPLYIIRDGEIRQVKADKFAIGINIFGKTGTFHNKSMELQEGDSIYLFSDGYPDQFGGANGQEKFMHDRFRDLLLSINNLPMYIQEQELQRTLQQWQGSTAQTDDILVLGVKI